MSGPAAWNVVYAPGSGSALLLVLHLPLLSFGVVPLKRSMILPLPVAPLNLPVYLSPTTV